MYQIKRDYIKIGNSRSGQRIGMVRFIVSHDTGNPGSTAYQNWNYFNKQQPSASAHTFIDDKYILEMIPLTEKAWHVQYNKPTDNRMFGDDANDAAIGVELCWGGKINFDEAYKRYVWYHAHLCKTYSLNPRKHIVSHKTLDPQRRSDPDNALNRYGITWNQFIDDVAKAYGEKPKAQSKEQSKQLYLLYIEGLLIGRYTAYNALKFAGDHLDKGPKEITMLRNDVAKAYGEKPKAQSKEQSKQLYLLYIEGLLIGRYTAYNALKFAGDHLDKGPKEITMLRNDVAKANSEKPKAQSKEQPKPQVGELYLLYVDGLLIGRYTAYNALKFAGEHLEKGAKEITMLRNDVAKANSEKPNEQSKEQTKPQVGELYLLYVDGLLIGRYTAYNALKFAGEHLEKGAKEITMLRNDVAKANSEKPNEQSKEQPKPQVGELYLLYVDGLLIGRYTAYNALKFAGEHLEKGAKEITMLRNDVAKANSEKPNEQSKEQPKPQVVEHYHLYVDGLLIGRYTAYNALKFAEEHQSMGAKEIKMVRV